MKQQHKPIEGNLAGTNAFLLSALELAHVGAWELDLIDHTANRTLEHDRIFGYSDLLPAWTYENFLAHVLPEDRPEVDRLFNEAIAKHADWRFECRIRRIDGEVRWIFASGGHHKDCSGAVRRMAGIVQDITARKQAEEAVVESEARYRLLADNMTDIIVRYDPGGVIEFASPSVRRLGFEPDQIVGRNMGEFVHPEDRIPTQPDGGAVPAGEGTFAGQRTEARVRRADGGWVWLESNPSPIRDITGNIIGAVTMLRDVSVRREMEEELRRKQAEAEAGAVAKGEFLANMSHEIRTPLTGIVGFAALMEKIEGLSPKAAKYAGRITAASRTLLAVVNDILDFSKIEAGQITLDPQPFDPRAFIGEILSLVADQAAAKGLQLRAEIRDDLPAGLNADSSRIGQVLLNLLNNAIKFTAEGEIGVAVSYLAADGEGGGVMRISVTDTGVGIPQDAVERLFQRFSQVDGSISRRFGGTGLGLAICKSLAELMGGAIGVDSREGAGSTFWFTVEAPVAALPQILLADESAGGVVTPARILIVDDLAANRELVSVMLSPFGHQLVEACSGAEAVEAAIHDRFNLILMDLQMPGMDGLAAARAIRETCECNQRTPIVALSADVLPDQQEACRAAGMADHISKPINPAELLYKVGLWAAPVEAQPAAKLCG